MSGINKWRRDFILETFMLFLSIKGRINFLQLGRYGSFEEQRFRQQFEKTFDFLFFNSELVKMYGSGHFAIAFDPSYISKSGKKTPGLGWYWSGCAGKSKWGLEIGGLAAIDIDNHSAFHLEAVQTVKKEGQTLISWYVELIAQREKVLSTLSKYMVADAWFSKKPFVDGLMIIGMHLISRLRDDANLKYLNTDQPTGKKGRPKKYDGKMDTNNLDKKHFELVSQDQDAIIHTAILYSVSLKMNIRLVHVRYTSAKGKETNKLYFSTDTTMAATDVLEYFRARFQIEFLYRDGKQHTGLEDGQARSENKLHFHFNTSLTSINIAKVKHWLSIPKEERKAFSMADVKTVNHNILMLERFLDVFAIKPHFINNNKDIEKLIYYGTIAA